jgi:hypothetical protein
VTLAGLKWFTGYLHGLVADASVTPTNQKVRQPAPGLEDVWISRMDQSLHLEDFADSGEDDAE